MDDKAALLSVLPPASDALLSSPSYPGGSSSVEFSLPAPSETVIRPAGPGGLAVMPCVSQKCCKVLTSGSFGSRFSIACSKDEI